MIEQDAERLRAVDQAAFRLGFWLGMVAGFGFGGFVAGVLLVVIRR